MSIERFQVPRVVRAKGYRSKAAGPHAVSSTSFAYRELQQSIRDATREERGNVGHGAPAPIGIGLALALRAKVWRGL